MPRGGYRPGAGRKTNEVTRLLKPPTAALILSKIDEIKAWEELIKSEDDGIKLKALMSLTDRRDGKAQPINEDKGDNTKVIVVGIQQQLQSSQPAIITIPPEDAKNPA